MLLLSEIVLEESGSDLSQTSDYARAEGVQRAKASKPQCPGEQYLINRAIFINIIMSIMYIDCAINVDIFLNFIEKCLFQQTLIF